MNIKAKISKWNIKVNYDRVAYINTGNNSGATIDDATISTTTTWSSSKINTELGTKADTSHTHSISDISNLQTTLDTKIDKPATATADDIAIFDTNKNVIDSGKKLADYALVNHTHALGDLSNVDETSKSDGQALVWDATAGTWKPATISGGGGTSIDDTTTSTTTTWSSSKINTELSTKANTTLDNVADNDILTKVKNVDGSGSGLDADLLDGLDSSAFSLVTHTHNISDLSDVSITTSTDGQILKYNATTSKWENVNFTHTHTTADITDFNTAVDNKISTHNTDTNSHIDIRNAVNSKPNIDDTATSTTNTWSSSKISTELSNKANSDLSNVLDSAILNKVKNVDGAGSGLDADLLDGLDSSAFASSSHTHTLDNLSDVSVATATDGQVLTYDNATGTWIPSTISGGNGTGKSIPTHFLSDYTDLASALTIIGSNEAILLIDRSETLTTTQTIPENITLYFQRGSILSGAVTLTINGGIQAGIYQIFGTDITISGTPKIEAVYPEWFGAVGDGTTDDTNAIQKAIDFALFEVSFQRKTYLVSTLNIQKRNLKLKGQGTNKKSQLESGDYTLSTTILANQINFGDTTNFYYKMFFEDLQFVSNDDTVTDFIVMNNYHEFIWKNVVIYSPFANQNGINIKNIWLAEFNFCSFYKKDVSGITRTGTGISIDNSEYPGSGLILFTGGSKCLAWDKGVYINYSRTINFSDFEVKSCKHGIWADFVEDIFFNDIHFEGNTTNGIRIVKSYNVKIDGGLLDDIHDTSTFVHIGDYGLDNIRTVSIKNVYFRNIGDNGAGIKFYFINNVEYGVTVENCYFTAINDGFGTGIINANDISIINCDFGNIGIPYTQTPKQIISRKFIGHNLPTGKLIYVGQLTGVGRISTDTTLLNQIYAEEFYLNTDGVNRSVALKSDVRYTGIKFKIKNTDLMKKIVIKDDDETTVITDVYPKQTAYVWWNGTNWSYSLDDELIGTSSNRPTAQYTGMQYFDTTLGKPIWWNGTAWIDATGTTV